METQTSFYSKPSSSSSSSPPPSATALSLFESDNNRQRQQIKCNMLLELNTIKTYNSNVIAAADNPSIYCNNISNYTDISCNHSSNDAGGCMSDSSCLNSACLACSISADCCHSHYSATSLKMPSKGGGGGVGCCSSPSSSSFGNTIVMSTSSPMQQDISNYMQCANLRNTSNIYNNNNNNQKSITSSASTTTTASVAGSCLNSSNNNDSDYNVAIRECNTRNENIILTINSNNNKCIDDSSACGDGECNSFPWPTYSNISHTLNGLIKYAIILIFLAMCDTAQAALSNVNLFVEPPAVRRSQSVTLRCQYSLEGAPLYSVKFYRGQLEFFRYTPDEYPNTKVFPYPGIKVDESVSNATQVVIRNVNFGLSGNFSCEVTADAPLFSTATAYAQMQVVEFPDKRPQLFTEHTRYEPGDVLRANCSTPPSRPRAELRFTINNIPVSSEETQYIRTVDNLIASRLSLKVQLQAVHFAAAAAPGANAGNSNSHMMNALGPAGTTYTGAGGSGTSAAGGALLLRCTAQIADLYQEYKEIELGTPQRDPVPARVTSSGGGLQGFLDAYFGPSSSAIPQAKTSISSCFLLTCILIIHTMVYGRR
uniref:Ig-like domain-containing protein n=1 Tax=Stomoxys calcitrans TaxID=35570 RepID=A0A1I8Q0S8_STOCA|nr:unnamed protein product [Stomoxys calcitrans]XP_013097822.1 unnamed protein product [Stomoxys calcitrans]XP_013097829.1 unnamed protein product [Stomoxys calcitrans]